MTCDRVCCSLSGQDKGSRRYLHSQWYTNNRWVYERVVKLETVLHGDCPFFFRFSALRFRDPIDYFPAVPNRARESPVLQSALARLGHVVLTLAEHVQLMADIFEFTEHTGVPFNEPVDVIPHPGLDAKLFDDRLERPEVVTRNPGEQVVDRLELKASVNEVHPGRTEDVHRSS